MDARTETERQLSALRVGLGLPEHRVTARVRQAVLLEAAAVPDELVQVMVKIGASGRVTAEDLYQIARQGYALTFEVRPPDQGSGSREVR